MIGLKQLPLMDKKRAKKNWALTCARVSNKKVPVGQACDTEITK